MTITVQKLQRSFAYNGIALPDPGCELSPEQVRDVYSATYPEITTASINCGSCAMPAMSFGASRSRPGTSTEVPSRSTKSYGRRHGWAHIPLLAERRPIMDESRHGPEYE